MIKQCEKCGKEMTEDKRFCSRSCANSRTWSKDINEKRSKTIKERMEKNSKWGFMINNENCHSKETIEKTKKVWKDKLLNTDFEELAWFSKRKRIRIEQNNKCNKCGIDSWLDKPIILEIDHKDGNRNNNSRDNLEGLCPNCHSLTDSWRGRNLKGSKKYKLVPKKVLELHKANKSIKDILVSLGATPKGMNYQIIRDIIEKENGAPYKT